MLQIIGWMGCFYLLIKALELAGSNSQKDAEGSIKPFAYVTVVLCLLGAIVFAFLFAAQGSVLQQSGTGPTGLSQSVVECISNPETDTMEEIAACND